MKFYKAINSNTYNSKKRSILGIRGLLAIVLFCMMISTGITSNAYPETPGTVIVDTAKIRPTADTSGAPLASVRKNEVVSICDEVTGADGNIWYQVFVNANTKGFIRSDLVQKADGSTPAVNQTTQTSQPAAELPETVATPTERRTATVVTNNVRIRKGASTKYEQVATANRGMVLTVTGEATGLDNKKWYQVSFSYNNSEITGFIRYDLVTFETLPPETSTSQINGTENEPETVVEPTTEVEPETQATLPEEQTPQEDTTQTETQEIVLMNVDETPYVLPAFTPVILKWEDQEINAYKNGDFYLFYVRMGDGEEGWYIFDSTKGVYQRYAYTSENAVLPKADSVISLPLIIALVLILALIAAVVYLFIQVKELDGEGFSFSFSLPSFRGSDDEEDDEEEEYDEKEETVIRRVPERRPVKRALTEKNEQERMESGRPLRERPVTEDGEVERPQRPRPQQGRPQQGRPQQGRPQQGRPQQGQAKRRPNPNGNPVATEGSGAASNRPTKKVPLQNGYKAKNFLASDDDDDMEFIDI